MGSIKGTNKVMNFRVLITFLLGTVNLETEKLLPPYSSAAKLRFPQKFSNILREGRS